MDNEQVTNMIDKILGGDNTAAKEDFEALIASKVSSALEVKKQEIAQSVYVNQEPAEEEISDESEEQVS